MACKFSSGAMPVTRAACTQLYVHGLYACMVFKLLPDCVNAYFALCMASPEVHVHWHEEPNSGHWRRMDFRTYSDRGNIMRQEVDLEGNRVLG